MRGRLKRGAWILAFLVALPIAGLFAGRAARWKAEVTFREQMERVVPPSERARAQTRPLAELCAVPGAETDVACDAYGPAVLLAPLSIVVAAAGLLALGLIVGAGAAARADLALLVTLFRPGLWALAACTIGLIAGHALVVVGIIAALGGVGPSLGGAAVVLVIGALAGCWAVARSLFGIFGPARIDVLGAVLTPAEAPALWQLVDELGARLGALRPDRIVAGLGVTFFVTESEVATPHEVVTGRTLCLSLPLARIFTVDELRAIIAHELGHFRGEDTAYSRQFLPIYRGATGGARQAVVGPRRRAHAGPAAGLRDHRHVPRRLRSRREASQPGPRAPGRRRRRRSHVGAGARLRAGEDACVRAVLGLGRDVGAGRRVQPASGQCGAARLARTVQPVAPVRRPRPLRGDR